MLRTYGKKSRKSHLNAKYQEPEIKSNNEESARDSGKKRKVLAEVVLPNSFDSQIGQSRLSDSIHDLAQNMQTSPATLDMELVEGLHSSRKVAHSPPSLTRRGGLSHHSPNQHKTPGVQSSSIRGSIDANRPESTLASQSIARTRTLPAEEFELSRVPTLQSFSIISRPAVVRRMLSRSRTDPSLRRINLPQITRGDSSRSEERNASSEPPESLLASSANLPLPENSIPLSNATLSRTYAGSSRSFLVNTADYLSTSQVGEDAERDSYAALLERWGADDSSQGTLGSTSNSSAVNNSNPEDPVAPVSLPPGMMNDVRSITEQRSKGETRRFLDEVGYIFEGLGPESELSTRRASALEMISKFSDVSFLRKARVGDFFMTAWENLQAVAGGDLIIDAAGICFAKIVARFPEQLADFANKTNLVRFLFNMLAYTKRDRDFLYHLSANGNFDSLNIGTLGRTERRLFKTLHATLVKIPDDFPDPSKISARLMTAEALAVLPAICLSQRHVPELLASLESELYTLVERVESFLSGLPLWLPDSQDEPRFPFVKNCLTLLESLALGQWSRDKSANQIDVLGTICSSGLLDRLFTLCVGTDILNREESTQRAFVYECMESALRILVTGSQESNQWGEELLSSRFATPFVFRVLIAAHEKRRKISSARPAHGKRKASEDEARALDLICLVLGLLTHLVQLIERAKDVVRDTLVDPDCPGKRRCILGCQCANRASALRFLVLLYSDQANLSSSDPGTEILSGHIAVLFGTLMLNNVRNEYAILNTIPGNIKRVKVETLLNQTEEFLGFYNALADKVSSLGSDNHDGNASQRRGTKEVKTVIGYFNRLLVEVDA